MSHPHYVQSADWNQDYDADDDALVLASASAYLCISVTAEELPSLTRIDGAEWKARNSLQAGTTLGQPVHWCLGVQPGTAQVLVGPDDETWDLAVIVPLGSDQAGSWGLARCRS